LLFYYITLSKTGRATKFFDLTNKVKNDIILNTNMTTKTYELTYLISSILTEDEAKALQSKIGELVVSEGGSVKDSLTPARKKLAYPINKEVQAYLAVIDFQLKPEKLANLEKALKAETQILRYLLLIKKPFREMKRSRLVMEPKVKKTKEEKRVELNEIEKKLEEILDESK
jgi:ribosomal protein S6